MSLALVRVDDRLIHGQVVVAWGTALAPDLIAVADDELAENDWERELYRAGVPEGVDVEFDSVEQAAHRVPDWVASRQRVILLLPDVASLVRLCNASNGIRAVNLGGVHGDGNRRQFLGYLFLSETELQQLEDLQARGIAVTAQDVPTGASVALEDLR
jgi:D-glucosaminate PTS system EIIB component